eukprot:1136313-Pelagomonas_calceolata.AAC.1
MHLLGVANWYTFARLLKQHVPVVKAISICAFSESHILLANYRSVRCGLIALTNLKFLLSANYRSIRCGLIALTNLKFLLTRSWTQNLCPHARCSQRLIDDTFLQSFITTIRVRSPGLQLQLFTLTQYLELTYVTHILQAGGSKGGASKKSWRAEIGLKYNGAVLGAECACPGCTLVVRMKGYKRRKKPPRECEGPC